DLQNPRITRGIVFAKKCPKHSSATCGPGIVCDTHSTIVVEDSRAGDRSRAAGGRRGWQIRRSVYARELRVVEYVERLKSQLQVPALALAQSYVFEYRHVMLVEAWVAKIHSRIRPDVADRRSRKR